MYKSCKIYIVSWLVVLKGIFLVISSVSLLLLLMFVRMVVLLLFFNFSLLYKISSYQKTCVQCYKHLFSLQYKSYMNRPIIALFIGFLFLFWETNTHRRESERGSNTKTHYNSTKNPRCIALYYFRNIFSKKKKKTFWNIKFITFVTHLD